MRSGLRSVRDSTRQGLLTRTSLDGVGVTTPGLTVLTVTPDPATPSARFFAAMIKAALRTEPVTLPVRNAFCPLTPTTRPKPGLDHAGQDGVRHPQERHGLHIDCLDHLIGVSVPGGVERLRTGRRRDHEPVKTTVLGQHRGNGRVDRGCVGRVHADAARAAARPHDHRRALGFESSDHRRPDQAVATDDEHNPTDKFQIHGNTVRRPRPDRIGRAPKRRRDTRAVIKMCGSPQAPEPSLCVVGGRSRPPHIDK